MLNKLKELREDHEDGFTLIELLVVILIIGILASIAIPVFLNQRKTANDGAVESDVKNAATQVESWIVGQKGANTVITAKAADLDSIKSAIKVSSGVSIAISGSANGYCIIGSHENGKNYDSATPGLTKTLQYNSATGGLGKACDAAIGSDAAAWNLAEKGTVKAVTAPVVPVVP